MRPPDSEVERLLADCSRANEHLGWRSAVDFEEGLRRTIEWMRGSLSSYKPSIYNV
jgi:nucleoside-diphosphate-sugar epimerase